MHCCYIDQLNHVKSPRLHMLEEIICIASHMWLS